MTGRDHADGIAGYRHLAVPTDSLYDLGETAGLEEAVRIFVADGGTMMHGAGCALAARAFGVAEETVPFDCIRWREDVIPHGWSTVAFTSEGEALGRYLGSGLPGILRSTFGRGRVLSIGFEYGYAYSRCTMPIVPPAYGRSEMHPVVLLERTPVDDEIGTSPSAPLSPVRGVEFARFGDRVVIVNHRASPVDLSGIQCSRRIDLVPSAPGLLAAHSAAYIEF